MTSRHYVMAMLAAGIAGSCQGGNPTIIGHAPDHPADYTVVTDADVTISNVQGIDAGCAFAAVRGQLRPSNLLFILDRSGSMACNLPEDGQSSADCAQFPLRRFPNLPSKWELTLSALQSALAALEATGRVRAALSTFPENGSACTVATEPQIPFADLNSAALNDIAQSLSSVAPYGNTPLVGATILGYQYVLDQMRLDTSNRENFVVLVTDGQETCRPDQVDDLLEIDAPNALQLLGIRTFVIGVPGSEDAREFLSALADAGGTVRSEDCYYGPEPTDGNCHFDMTTTENFGTDLLDALTKINAEVLSCTFSIPSTSGGTSVDLARINVALNNKNIPFEPGGSCTSGIEGWQYTPGNASIRLCGLACSEAQTPGSEVSIVLGCPTEVW